MNRVRGLTIDNGGSEARILAYDPLSESKIVKFANDFVSIREKDFREKDVDEPGMLCRILEAPSDDYKGIIAQGLTGKAFDGQSIIISSQTAKTSNIDYYKQLIFCIAQDALQAWVVNGGYSMFSTAVNGSDCFPAARQYKYAVVICIPIKEFNGVKDCATVLKSKLEGHYVVEFPLLENKPVVEFVLDANLIGVVPEGGVAITGIRKELNAEDVSLVIDMGHVSTDIALFMGSTLLGKVVSSQFAGSTLVANMRAALADEGYILSESQLQNALSTKLVRNGKSYVDISDIVREQSQIFVRNYLQKEIIQVLNMNAVNAKQVQNFIPIGAPMNKPSSNPIIEEILKSCGLENSEVKILAEDLRYVNISQASKFTKKLVAKARM